jgi:hypothetical protein
MVGDQIIKYYDACLVQVSARIQDSTNTVSIHCSEENSLAYKCPHKKIALTDDRDVMYKHIK